jgi:hypothetical protein
MTPCAYRSLQPAVRERIEALCERRRAEHDGARAVGRVAARRIGWSVAGGAGTAMGAAALLCGLLATGASYPERDHASAAATVLLLATWPIALLAGLVGVVVARISTMVVLEAPLTTSADTPEELARLQACDPRCMMRSLAVRWEFASAAFPLAALSLAAPLTIHWVIAQLLAIGTSNSSPEDFGRWIGLSALIVGHAHLVLLVVAVRAARSLRACATDNLRTWAGQRWVRALLWAVGVAAVPGVVLLVIPPVLVAVTGLVFVPAMYALTAKRIERERIALGVD